MLPSGTPASGEHLRGRPSFQLPGVQPADEPITPSAGPGQCATDLFGTGEDAWSSHSRKVPPSGHRQALWSREAPHGITQLTAAPSRGAAAARLGSGRLLVYGSSVFLVDLL